MNGCKWKLCPYLGRLAKDGDTIHLGQPVQCAKWKVGCELCATDKRDMITEEKRHGRGSEDITE